MSCSCHLRYLDVRPGPTHNTACDEYASSEYDEGNTGWSGARKNAKGVLPGGCVQDDPLGESCGCGSPPGLTLDEYQDGAGTFDKGHSPEYYALGLGEAGEAQGKVKKVERDHDGVWSDEMRNAVIDELGDNLWYIARLAKRLGYTLEDVAQQNLSKLADRHARGVIGGSGDYR